MGPDKLGNLDLSVLQAVQSNRRLKVSGQGMQVVSVGRVMRSTDEAGLTPSCLALLSFGAVYSLDTWWTARCLGCLMQSAMAVAGPGGSSDPAKQQSSRLHSVLMMSIMAEWIIYPLVIESCQASADFSLPPKP